MRWAPRRFSLSRACVLAGYSLAQVTASFHIGPKRHSSKECKSSITRNNSCSAARPREINEEIITETPPLSVQMASTTTTLIEAARVTHPATAIIATLTCPTMLRAQQVAQGLMPVDNSDKITIHYYRTHGTSAVRTVIKAAVIKSKI